MEAKKIIITGGATRIGSAIAKSLAGYDVDIVITMLPTGTHVRDVYLGDDGILACKNNVQLLIDCSSIVHSFSIDIAFMDL